MMSSSKMNGKKSSSGRGGGGRQGGASGKTYHFQTKPQSASSYTIDDENNGNVLAVVQSSSSAKATRKLSSGPYLDRTPSDMEFEDPDHDVEMFTPVHARKSRLSSSSSSSKGGGNKDGSDDGHGSSSLGLFRFSVIASALMMCFLVYTIYSKDSQEEQKWANQNENFSSHHHHNNYGSPYTFEEGTKPAIVPMGTYNTYDGTSNTYSRGHDNTNNDEYYPEEGEGDDEESVPPPGVAEEESSSTSVVPFPFDIKLADVYDFPITELQTPFYWHIPRSGGTTLEKILSECLGLTVASQVGAEIDPQQESLKIVQQDDTTSAMGDDVPLNYVNVDVSTSQGIQKAKEMGLVSSGFADVIISPLIYDSMDLFFENMQGRMFTVIRHPIERAVSEFNYLKQATWEPTYHPEFQDMTLLEYAHSNYIEGNWMVRSLSNTLDGGDIPSDALEKAKTILKEKCLIGLMENYKSTVHRVVDYFGWDISILRQSAKAWTCQEDLIAQGVNASEKKAPIEEGSDEWYAILQHNELDMELYTYAQQLYRDQQDIPAFGVN